MDVVFGQQPGVQGMMEFAVTAHISRLSTTSLSARASSLF